MSYILDALRKADAQRERDPARGIHAQALPSSANAGMRPNGASALVAGALAVAVLLAGWGGWHWYRGNSQESPQMHSSAPAATHAATGPATMREQPVPVVGTTAPTPVVGPAAIPAAAIDPPAPPPRASVAASDDARGFATPNRRGSQMAGATTAPAARIATPVNVAQAQVPGAGVPAAQSPASAVAANPALAASAPGVPPTAGSVPSPRLNSAPLAVPGAQTMAPQPGTPPPPPPPVAVVVAQPPVAGLPPDAPKLAVSGGVYSSNPAQRMLIVNGQVFNEGSEVAAGVVLDEIKSKTAVLRFRGARYTVAF